MKERNLSPKFSADFIENETVTDEWGVTYTDNGRILKDISLQLFTCEEYIIPEGVEIIERDFVEAGRKLHKVHLPSTLREMECNTFIGCPIEELELPEGMQEVPDCMCESCPELKRVILPSTLSCIGIAAFNGCSSLQEIKLPGNIEHIGDNVFSNCVSLKHVQLPPKLAYLAPELFAGSGIESIEIHSNIEKIGYEAFWGCKHLKHLVIPKTVTQIEYGIVTACEGFNGIECHAKGYHVENEALIDDKNHELLCCWSQQKHYVVPECVKRIACMNGNDFVETITVNQPVELTTYNVFAACKNLCKVDFKGGVTGMDKYTFYNCPKIETCS